MPFRIRSPPAPHPRRAPGQEWAPWVCLGVRGRAGEKVRPIHVAQVLGGRVGLEKTVWRREGPLLFAQVGRPSSPDPGLFPLSSRLTPAHRQSWRPDHLPAAQQGGARQPHSTQQGPEGWGSRTGSWNKELGPTSPPDCKHPHVSVASHPKSPSLPAPATAHHTHCGHGSPARGLQGSNGFLRRPRRGSEPAGGAEVPQNPARGPAPETPVKLSLSGPLGGKQPSVPQPPCPTWGVSSPLSLSYFPSFSTVSPTQSSTPGRRPGQCPATAGALCESRIDPFVKPSLPVALKTSSLFLREGPPVYTGGDRRGAGCPQARQGPGSSWPPQRPAEDVPRPDSCTCERGLVWKEALCRCRQVKLRSLGWAQTQ